MNKHPFVLGLATALVGLSFSFPAVATSTYHFDRHPKKIFTPLRAEESDTFFNAAEKHFIETVQNANRQPWVVWRFEGFAQAVCGSWIDAMEDPYMTQNRFIVIGERVLFMPVEVADAWTTNCGPFVGAQE